VRTILAFTYAGRYHFLRIDIIEPVVSWTDHAQAALRRAGHRSGAARRAVIDLLADERCCRTAQELHDVLRASGRPVGVASVYRTLDLLAGLDLVNRIEVGDGVARYERAEPGGEHHHHLVCGDCGRVEAFEDERLERAIHGLASRISYDLAGHDVVLRGSCDECRAA
jgi:Fur family ferric uptake transcriptional regulator